MVSNEYDGDRPLDVAINTEGFGEGYVRNLVRNAAKEFADMRAALESFARVSTKKPDLRVRLTWTKSYTDGSDIYVRPPLALGKITTKHDTSLCNQRTSYGESRCMRCAVHDLVMARLVHEISHIAYNSFEAAKDADIMSALRRLVSVGKVSIETGEQIREALLASPDWKNVATVVSPFLPPLVNVVEDVRIDLAMARVQPGSARVRRADIIRRQESGGEFIEMDGEKQFQSYRMLPLNTQLTVAYYMAAMDAFISTAFDDRVVEAMESSLMRDFMRNVTRQVRTVRDSFHAACELLEVAKQLGFFPEPEKEDPEESGEDSDPSESESSPKEDDDDSSQKDDESSSESSDDSDDSDEGDESEQDSSQEESDGREGEEEDGEGSSDGEGEDSDSSDDEGASESSDQDGDSEDDSPEGGDGADSSNEGEGDDSGSAGTGSDEASESDGDDSESEGGGGSDAQDGSEEGDDDSASGSPADESTGDGEEEAPSGGSGSGGAGSGENSESSGDVDEDENYFDDDAGDYEHEAKSESVPDGDDGESESGEGDHESGEPGEGEGEWDPSEFEDKDDEDNFVDPDDKFGGDEPLDRQPKMADRDLYGTPEDLEEMFEKLAHQSNASQDKVAPEQLKALEEETLVVDSQLMAFDGVRRSMIGLYVSTPTQHAVGPSGEDLATSWTHDYAKWSSLAWLTPAALGIEGDFEPKSADISRLVGAVRPIFDANKRSAKVRNLKSGDVAGPMLARRVPFGDPRAFQKKRRPAKRDYAVGIGIDLSASTTGINLLLLKQCALVMADAMNALPGVKFAVWGHSAHFQYKTWKGRGAKRKPVHTYDDQLITNLYQCKTWSEPWTNQTRAAVSSFGPDAENCDGHTLEWYRKQMEAVRATDKVLFYFTDGQMPYTNFDEELTILRDNLVACERSGIGVVGVGINTDSPSDHGLDTVSVSGPQDVHLVAEKLRDRLLS